MVASASIGQCIRVEENHHIYKPGFPADACLSGTLHQSYWTRAKHEHGKKSSALVGTAFAQKLVWEHQHPSDCRAAEYLIWIPTPHGIGSNVHCMGQALSHAMNLNRVLLLAEDHVHPYYDPEFCNTSSSFHDCYFEPLSSCSISDAAAVLGSKSIAYEDLNEVPPTSFTNSSNNPEDKVVKLTNIPAERSVVPRVFDAFLITSPIDPRKFYYWWRAQSVAFLIRPNAKLYAEMDARKSVLFPNTIDRGTISCHIRHGDKWIETQLVEDTVYVKAIEHVYQRGNYEGSHLGRNVFLSTEDPESVKHFLGLKHWKTSYLDIPRKPDHTKTTVEYAKELGPAHDMIHSMINLDLALQCDAWVGTLSSNWCRLIDELRSTVRCKAHGVYWDAQQDNPPENLDWRKFHLK